MVPKDGIEVAVIGAVDGGVMGQTEGEQIGGDSSELLQIGIT